MRVSDLRKVASLWIEMQSLKDFRRGAGAFTDKSRSADRRSPAKLSSGKYGLRMTSNRQRIADDKAGYAFFFKRRGVT